MAQQTINSNSGQPLGGPNTGLGSELGDTWDAAVLKMNNMFTDLYGVNTSPTFVNAGSTLALTSANNGNVIKLNATGGSTVTLPVATGSGNRFSFIVTVLATSNSHIVKRTNASGDIMTGLALGLRADSVGTMLGFATQSNSNTITFNRSTTGSVTLGEWIECIDIAANTWQTKVFYSSTGASPATPYSNT